MIKTKTLSGLSAWFIASILSIPLIGCDEDHREEEALENKVAPVSSTTEKDSKVDDVGTTSTKVFDAKQPMCEPKGKLELEKSVQPGVDASVGKKVNEKRDDIEEEARIALEETKHAVDALGDENPNEAMEALARVTGKLEILLAREPELALAPTGVDVVTHDIVGTLDDIKEMRDEAETLLENGEVQKARKILSGLTSEIVISVVNIPLASYPDAIKAVSPLIDEGKTKAAKLALQTALSTLVVTESVIPIPILRAEQLLAKAESLVEKSSRTTDDGETLSDLMDNVRYQIKLASALGYGDKEDYGVLDNQMEELEEKISTEKSGKGFFDGIKKSLSDFKKSLFE